MSRRTQKVASLLQQEIGNYLLRLELPVLTTISKVEVTPDLKWCKTWITIMGNENKQKAVMEILHRQMFELQGELIRKLEMKIVPRVKFMVDHGEEYAEHINKLLKEAHEE
jgi:ribosome-binding factor A